MRHLHRSKSIRIHQSNMLEHPLLSVRDCECYSSLTTFRSQFHRPGRRYSAGESWQACVMVRRMGCVRQRRRMETTTSSRRSPFRTTMKSRRIISGLKQGGMGIGRLCALEHLFRGASLRTADTLPLYEHIDTSQCSPSIVERSKACNMNSTSNAAQHPITGPSSGDMLNFIGFRSTFYFQSALSQAGWRFLLHTQRLLASE